jgi:hypothetical protein
VPDDPLGAVPLFYMRFRALYVGLGVLGVLLLWRRPRPRLALALVVALNLLAWVAYVAPLRRLYGLGEGRDRAFNLGMAACTAATGVPWDFVQVRQAAVEPFWNTLVAALALFDPARVLHAYQALAPLSILAVAFGLFAGLRTRDDEADAWERVLIVTAMLGLSSWSMSLRPPVPLLWAGNFLLKPNHAAAWGVVGVVLGLWARGARARWLGAALGLLAWVFLLEWPYVVLALLLATLMKPPTERDWGRIGAGVGISALVALPDVLNFAREHLPTVSAGNHAGVWQQPRLGPLLALPQWSVLDLAPLVMLGGAGALAIRIRGRSRDRALLGLLAAAGVITVAYLVGAFVGIAPGPDEAHYFLRFALSLAAGAGLAAGSRLLEARGGLGPGQGHLLALGICVPLSFPAWFDPPTMDRYYASNREPIPRDALDYGRWVRENTPPDAVFVAGRSAGTWIPALAGRRVLRSPDRIAADHAEREAAERTILTSRDPEAVSAAARRWGVTHVAVDGSLLLAYGPGLEAWLAGSPAFEAAPRRPGLLVFRIRAP